MKTKQQTGLKIALCLTVVSALSQHPAEAADKKDRAARESQRRVMQMKQQLEAEKAQLQAQFQEEKTGLEAKVQEGEKKNSTLQSGLASANRRNAALSAELDALHKEKSLLEAQEQGTDAKLRESQSELETTRKKLTELAQQFQNAQSEVKDGEAQRKELQSTSSKRGQQLAACDEKNARLYDFGLELINVYEHPGAHQAVEPFTQIKRVELENILQEFRDKLDAQHVVQSVR